MFKLFEKENPGLVKLHIYRKVFNNEFNLSFGYPRTDICKRCEVLQKEVSLAEAQKDTEKFKSKTTEKTLHLARAKAWKERLSETTEEAKNDPTVCSICFDYEKNIPIPLTNVGEEYYKRQLWLHNLGFNIMGSNRSIMCMYAEHFAKKGPNDVISCLDYVLNSAVGENVTTVRLMADNCFAQNKNRYLFAYLQNLTLTGRFKKITLDYPISGHSYMNCDRDFALIEKERRKKEQVFAPSEWVKTVEEAREKPSPFEVVFVERALTDDMKPDGRPIIAVYDYKKALTPFLKSSVEGLTDFRGLEFAEGTTMARKTMKGSYSIPVTLFKKKCLASDVSEALSRAERAYSGILPIKPAKLADVRALLSNVLLPKGLTFFDSLIDCERAESDVDDHELAGDYEEFDVV